MKKILYILSGLDEMGGISKYNRDFLDVLIKQGYLVKIVSKGNNGKLFFALRTLWQAIFFNPDLIICSHVNFSPLCYLASFLGKRYIVLSYGIDVWSITSKIKRRALKKAALVTAISNFTKEKIIDQIPQIKDRIPLVPNAIDGLSFYPKPKSGYLINRHNLTKEDKIILTVTRLDKRERYKGYYEVVNALPHILTKIPQAKYLLVGGGNDLANIQKHIREKKLEDSVIFAGYVSDNELIDYYNLSDVFVMPSKGEGFGFVFLEALACGKPVIAGNKDGSRDALLDGQLGILVNPDNIAGIARAIIRVLKKEMPAKLLDRHYLRKRVLEVYGFDKFRQRVKELIRSF